MRELRSEELDALKSKIREHPAFHGGLADAEDCLDFLQVTLAKFGKYELMDECLADWCKRQWPIMDEATFKRAVAITRQAFLSRPEFEETPAETRVRVYRKILTKRGRDDYLRGLIADSAHSKLAWDAVKLIAEDLLRDGEHLPPELAEWLADVLSDLGRPGKDKRRARPTKGGPPEANRDWIICGAIQYVGTLYDLPPTRNGDGPEKCCAEGGSACDVVGRAVFGATLKAYKNTERIWGKHDPLLSYTTRSKS